MSRIWAALPLLKPLDPNAPRVPAGACWWRHPLTAGPDGHEMLVRVDSTTDAQSARLGCWEWFDGLDEQLIFGVDVYGMNYSHENQIGRLRSYLDVLALDVPTRSPSWTHLTIPDEWRVHYDERGPYTVAPYPVPPFSLL